MTKKDEDRTRQIFDDIIAPLIIQQSSDSKQTNITLLGIEKHLEKLNGSVLEHQKAIEELKLAGLKHIIECPAMGKIETISNDLEEYRVIKKYPKVALLIIAFFVITTITTIALAFKASNQLVKAETSIKNSIDNMDGVSKVTRSGIVKYNDNGLTDSIKIR